MHYDILLISHITYYVSFFSPLNVLLSNDSNVNDDFSIIMNNDKITFDYIITDRFLSNFRIMKEDKKMITNQFFETSVDNIYAFSDIVNTEVTTDKQLEIIKKHILNYEKEF